MKRNKTKQTAQYACLLGIAMMVSYIENLIPFDFGIPGAKLGLVNSVIVLCMYLFGAVPALIINVARIILTGLLFTNVYSIMYSLAGAILSFIVMIAMKHMKCFGMVGVSVAGGTAHNIGQLLLAFMITQTSILVYYFPVLLVLGCLTGLLNGCIVKTIYHKIKKVVNQES